MPAPIPVTSEIQSILPYQFHQVAIYVNSVDLAIAQYKVLGFKHWISDTASLYGDLDGERMMIYADMSFCYDIMPMELEFLRYIGDSRHHRHGRVNAQGETVNGNFISHMSAYVDDVKESSIEMTKWFGPPYHRFITKNHTNKNVRQVKRFIESIFDTRHALGYDLKLIQKVPHDYKDSDWLDWELPL